MKIKLDENLPSELVPVLEARGHDVHTIPQEQLIRSPDAVVFEQVTREGRFLLTQDLDFSDIRKYKPGTHEGIAMVRLRSPSRANLLKTIARVVNHEPMETWVRCFVVITETKIRVRRP